MTTADQFLPWAVGTGRTECKETEELFGAGGNTLHLDFGVVSKVYTPVNTLVCG